VTRPLIEPPAVLRERVDDALRARDRLRARPFGETIAGLAAAAARWRGDAALAAALPAAARLSRAMTAAVLPLAAEAIDADVMTALVERERGSGATGRAAREGPALVAHVLASNVPALALPAIALGCLAGAAVLVKSGRDDPLSAPAFHRALSAADPELAATVVTAYWPGGDPDREEAGLGRAPVVVVTGGDATLAALGERVRGRLVAHGPRVSVAAVGRTALADAAAVAEALAVDVALHDQRGCLSPHAVYVETGGPLAPPAFAERLATALGAVAQRLPPGPAGVAERAAARLLAAEAEWIPGAAAIAGDGGTVVYEDGPTFRPTCGLRTVRVHPLADADALPALLPAGAVECVGLAGIPAAPLSQRLRALGVSRICPVGRMQRPPLSWPRGQHAPLGVLLGRDGAPQLAVET
jgi:hypothetical protein